MNSSSHKVHDKSKIYELTTVSHNNVAVNPVEKVKKTHCVLTHELKAGEGKYNPLSLKTLAMHNKINQAFKRNYDKWEGKDIISLTEYSAIRHYTGNSYSAINKYLRSAIEGKAKTYPSLVKSIMSGINKLNKHRDFKSPNKVYRVVVFDKESDVFKISEGSIMDRGFLSAAEAVSSLDKLIDNHLKDACQRLVEYTKGNEMIKILIFGSGGARVKTISLHPEENEVIFQPSTVMEVLLNHTGVMYKKDKELGVNVRISTRQIVMQETDEEKRVTKKNTSALKSHRRLSW